MYNIQLLNKISPCGTNQLDRSLYAVGDAIENPDAIYAGQYLTLPN